MKSSNTVTNVPKKAKTISCHILVVEDDQGRQEIVLDQQTYLIGRHKSCQIRLLSQFVSRRHALLTRKQRANGTYYYVISDGDGRGNVSANGLMINGRKYTEYALQDMDEIIFGPQIRARYFLIDRDVMSEESVHQTDEFDITLINPGMVDDSESLS